MSSTAPATARLVGQRIADTRRQARLTQKELAARLGWPLDTLINYEHGRRALSVERLALLAEALGTHPATLLIADAGLAQLVTHLARSAELQGQVTFFLTTLDDPAEAV